MRGSTVFLAVTLVLSQVWCAPRDLSCQGVARRKSFELRDCTFQHQNHAHVQCVHHVTATAGRGKPTFIIEVRSTFKVKPQQDAVTIDQTSFPWCLSVDSMHLSRVQRLPESAPNVFPAPATIASSLHDTIDDFSVTIDFNTDASVGFLAVNQGCDPLAHSPPPSDSCISHLRGTSFIVSPVELVDFDLQDLVGGNIKKFYFEKMNARISAASVRMVQGPEIRNWLPFFQDTKLQRLNLDHNPLYGELDYKLKNLPTLKFLSMRNCSINQIDPKNFENGTVNLMVLDLSHNTLTEAPAGLNALTQLQELKMTNQETGGEPFELHENLRGLSNLRVLNISHNKLSSIARSSLPNSAHLELLDLSHCGLTSLPADTFQDLVGLVELRLNCNNLSAIAPGTFSKQSPTTVVDLQDTGLTKSALTGQKVILVYDGGNSSNSEVSGVSSLSGVLPFWLLLTFLLLSFMF